MAYGTKTRSTILTFATALLLVGSLACGSTEENVSLADGGKDSSFDVQEPEVRPLIHVTMNAYTQGGTGANTDETYLNVLNVRSSKFGKLFTRAVDGDLYAQPLYLGGLKMPEDGKIHNVVFLATSHDSVYAYDADDKTSVAPLWKRSLGNSTPVPSKYLSWEWSESGCPETYSIRESGITATPVIDPATNTMYVVALNVVTSDAPGGTCFDTSKCPAPGKKSAGVATTPCNAYTVTYQLHALDTLTGDEKLSGPVNVGGEVSGSGAASVSGKVKFDAGVELVRTGLLLVDHGGQKTVYFAAASYNDAGNYHGWMFAYDASTLKQTGLFNDTPNGSRGGIWQSGRGPIADKGGNVYVVTGNGTFDVGTGMGSGDDWGDTALRFNADAAPTLSGVGDYFTQFLSDYQKQNLPDQWDDDLGSAGATIIPNTTMMLVTGKLGIGYLLDTANMGHWSPTADHVVQKLRLTWRTNKKSCSDRIIEAQVYGTPIAWIGPDGTHIYVWAAADYLRDYLLDANGKLKDSGKLCWCDPWVVEAGGKDLSVDVSDPDCAAPQTQGYVAAGAGSTGGALAVSSYGSERGSGVLWATYANPSAGSALHSTVPGILAAYDATNVSDPIWISTNSSTDTLGAWAKFTPPTVANGKVYVPTFSKELAVYGLVSQ